MSEEKEYRGRFLQGDRDAYEWFVNRRAEDLATIERVTRDRDTLAWLYAEAVFESAYLLYE